MRCDQRHVLVEDLGDAAQIVVISQIYVEREFRGQGLAKGTLKLLLNRRELVAVDMVTPDLEGLMSSLGFRRSSRRQLFAGQGRGDDEPAPVLFRRRRLSRARDVENNC
jgi:GNAT superfamily N-acetyltransferase